MPMLRGCDPKGATMLKCDTILLIDEDATARFMMREIARALDVNVETARSGGEGINWLRETPNRFAMILVNLQICNRSDDETIRTIRTAHLPKLRDIPIVAVCDYPHPFPGALAREAEVDECVNGPVTPAQLLSLMDRYFTSLIPQG